MDTMHLKDQLVLYGYEGSAVFVNFPLILKIFSKYDSYR